MKDIDIRKMMERLAEDRRLEPDIAAAILDTILFGLRSGEPIRNP